MTRLVDDPIAYVHFSGPAINALNYRKEQGSAREIPEQEMRDSYERVKDRLFAGLLTLTNGAR